MDIKSWAEQFCPQFLRAYERSQIPFEALVPGTKVMTLRYGFSGGPGEIRVVQSVETDHRGQALVRLVSPTDESRVSLLYKDDDREGPWYFQVAILTEEQVQELKKMTHKKQLQWEAETFGNVTEKLNTVASIKGWDR